VTTRYNVCDHGAVGDGRTNDGTAIQPAIDTCSSHGGGIVLLPYFGAALETVNAQVRMEGDIGGSAFPEVVPAMLNTSPFDQPGDPR